jgi:cytochrome b involved in lipid metabolism/nitrite reductase/ring-hydroxylating ferredoxin subunit
MKKTEGEGWVHVGTASVVSRNGSRFHTRVKGRYVSVIRTSPDEIFCIDAVCYHAGGPLTLGDIEDIDGDACVKCPWHHYAIRLEDGKKLIQGLDVVNGVMVPTGWQATSRSLQRTHQVKIEKGELFICLSNEGRKDRACRSDSYAYNEAAGKQVLGRVDTRAGSDGVMRSKIPSGKVFNKNRKSTKTRTSGSLKFRVESPAAKQHIYDEEIEEEEEEEEEEKEKMDIDDVAEKDDDNYDDGKARSRRVVLEPGYSDMDWARLQRTTRQVYDGKRKVTAAELSRHRSRDDLWIALRGKVYDVTKYLPYHPGGVEEVIRGAGEDATQLFNEVHRWIQASQMLSKYCVGTFVVPSDVDDNVDDDKDAKECWHSFDVIRIKRVANRTNLITCRYEKGKWPLGASIRCGEHVHVTVRRSKSSPTLRPYRAYTPVAVRTSSLSLSLSLSLLYYVNNNNNNNTGTRGRG